MNNTYWILAANGTDGQDGGAQVLTGDQGQEGQTQQMTTEPGENGTDQQTPPKPQGPGMGFFIIIIAAFAVMFLMTNRGQKKRQQEQTKMISSLKKNDRIRTIGGIYGTVLDVRENEITIKIDENTNAKVKVSPGAIAEVVSEKGENK